MGFLAAIPAAFATLATASATTSAAALASASATVAMTSAAVGAVGAGVAGYAQYKQSQFQAQVAKNNQIISKYNENSSLQQGQEQETLSREGTTRRVAGALAAQGANGLDVGFGTTEGVRGAIQNEGDLDALTIRYNAAQRAAGFAIQGSGFASEAAADKAAGGNALIAAGINAGSSVIGGAQSVSNIKFQQSLFANTGGFYGG